MPADLSALIAVLDPVAAPTWSFRQILIVALLACAVVLVLHLLLTGLPRRNRKVDRPRWNWWQRLVYLGTLLSVAVLGCTAFSAVLRHQMLDGWLLFAHMFGAGAFTAILPLLAITWSPTHCVRVSPSESQSAAAPEAFFWLPKLTFWLLLTSGIVVAGTMLVSMLPLFGTVGLERLLDLHRYSGLVAVIALVLHLYGVLLQRAGLR
jgi:multisubunit Na+/H+ antiporter MnhB subunit